MPVLSEPCRVQFDVECDDFSVPEWPGLRCSATCIVNAELLFDRSGDHITPNGGPDLLWFDVEPREWEISVVTDDCELPLPSWLAVYLVGRWMCAFVDAFKAAVGGEDKLIERACEKVSGW